MPSNPIHEAGVKRLCRLAAKLDDATWAAGEAWYPSEAAWITEAARRAGVEPSRGIIAYAALSPRLRLAHNRADFVNLAEGQPTRFTFRRNVETASRCLAMGTLPNGPKVRRFALNLLGHEVPVTVDVHAMVAAGFDGIAPGTAKRYEFVERVYQGAAKRLGVAPRTLQAATWLHVRGVKPSDHREAVTWQSIDE